VIEGIGCRNVTGIGFQIAAPAGATGIALRGVTASRAGGDGIAVGPVADLSITGAEVLSAGGDGIRLTGLTGPGPYEIRSGLVRGSGDDGIDLVRDVRGLVVGGMTLDANRDNGVESDHAGSIGLGVESSVLSRNRGSGVVLSGGSGHRVVTSQITGNIGNGANIGRGSGIRLEGDRFDGTNRLGDLRFSANTRTGGIYRGLSFFDTLMTLPGEPNGVVVSSATPAQRARVSPLPAGFSTLGRFVRVRDTGGTIGSAVGLAFNLTAADLNQRRLSQIGVFEDDPAGNARTWQVVPNATLSPGRVLSVTLTDGQIASGNDNRFAVYAPLAPGDSPPGISSVVPRPSAVVRGRNVTLVARVRDDEGLTRRSFRLVIDGKARGGARFRNGVVRYRLHLGVGSHKVVLKATDRRGQLRVREWRFRVRNGAPAITLGKARPRPGRFVLTSGRVVLSVPVRDDQPLRPRQVTMRVDGRRVGARLRNGLLAGELVLAQGRHRVTVVVRDRNGARVAKSWSFRTVRP
jgi:hypothetical protein